MTRSSNAREYRSRWRARLSDWATGDLYRAITERSTWMGVQALKNPLDAWIYQEVLAEVRPQAIVELGSAFGGGTLFLCHMLDLIGDEAIVISVDHSHEKFGAEHERIVKITGDTRDPATVGRVRGLVDGKRTLVIHDASHEADDVLADLHSYGSLVSPGSYLIVEDGVQDVATLRWGRTRRPGPLTAIERFLFEHPEFEPDEERERYVMTYNPMGFLRRTE